MRQLTIISIFIHTILLLSCANQGVPDGGEKDETPPKIIKSLPSNHSVSFNKRKIVLEFDEFVALKDTRKNLTISPPQKKQPRVRLKERAIVIEIRDSLQPNTTYTIDFGKSIADNNEGNSLGEYRYVFSTGQEIDTLAIGGYVKYADTNEDAEDVFVGLYKKEEHPDSLFKLLPNYIAKTDSMGFFMITNIPDESYRILAFDDSNSNKMLDEDEKVGFLKERIFPGETMQQAEDTLRFDKYTLFKNTEINLKLSTPIPQQQYLKEAKRLKRNKLLFVFNTKLKDSLKVKLLNAEQPQFIVENLRNNDSLFYWILDTNIAKKDTLLAQLDFWKTNKENKLVPFLDTLKLTFKEKKKQRNKDKAKKIVPDFIKIGTNLNSPYDYFQPIVLDFDVPVVGNLENKISLVIPVDSITVKEQKITLKRDSVLPNRRFYINADLQPKTSYVLKIDSAQIYTIDGRFNNTISEKITTHREEYYGKIFVKLYGGDDSVLMQLLDKGNKDKVVATEKRGAAGRFVFNNVPKGEYRLKVFWDKNGNRKWDDGDFRAGKYPEEVQIFKKDIKLPANWEMEAEWTLKK